MQRNQQKSSSSAHWLVETPCPSSSPSSFSSLCSPSSPARALLEVLMTIFELSEEHPILPMGILVPLEVDSTWTWRSWPNVVVGVAAAAVVVVGKYASFGGKAILPYQTRGRLCSVLVLDFKESACGVARRTFFLLSPISWSLMMRFTASPNMNTKSSSWVKSNKALAPWISWT